MNTPDPHHRRAPGMPAWVGKALLAIACLFLLQAAEPVLLPLTVAVLLTFLLFGPVRGLSRLGVPPAVGAALVVGALLGSLGLVGNSLVEPASAWWERAPSNLQQLADTVDRLRAAIPGLEPPRKPPRSSVAPPDLVKEQLTNQGVTMTRAVLRHAWHFAVVGAATVILLYFLLASEYRLLSRTVEAIPSRRMRVKVLAGVRQAQREIGRYLATAGLINMAMGAATGLALQQIGLPSPLLWGTMVAVLNFVPYIGPLILAGMLLLAGTLTFGVALQMLAPAAAFLALHALEANLVTPIVVGRRLRLSPISVFLSVLVWGWLWGIAGAFIAVPMLLALRATCQRVRRWHLLYAYLNETSAPPARLRSLVGPRHQ